MVRCSVTASVALLQLAMFARTSVALPIEYPEGLESRAISDPNVQQLAERDDTGLEARSLKHLAIGAAVIGAVLVGHHMWKNQQNQAQVQSGSSGSSGSPGQQLQPGGSQIQTTNPVPGETRRDLSNLYGDEYEKRNFNEFEERDWDDYEVEARGLDFDELDELD